MASGDLTERERMTPHWMKKLESVHANGEGGLTFVPSKRKLPGEPYRLSAAQISRWIDFLVRAFDASCEFCEDSYGVQHDGTATIYEPPNDGDLFSPLFHDTILHPERRAAAAATAGIPSPLQPPSGPSPAQSDLAHLSNIVTMIFDARTGTSSDVAQSNSPSGNHSSTSPSTPPRETRPLPALPTSPVRPTPTKIPRFLKYAETELGIPNATCLQFSMEAHAYGPDILDSVADAELMSELKIKRGDVLRLKRGAPVWWNGPLAKRPRVDVEVAEGEGSGGASARGSPDGRQEDMMKVRFERRWADGAQRLYGPRIVKWDGPTPERDYEDWYFSEEADDWLKVPEGYIPEFCSDYLLNGGQL